MQFQKSKRFIPTNQKEHEQKARQSRISKTQKHFGKTKLWYKYYEQTMNKLL